MPTFLETHRSFFVATSLALGLFILFKLSKVRGNNGNKLLYVSAVIALIMSLRELDILAMTFDPRGRLIVPLIPFVYGAQSILVITAFVMMKLRGSNAGTSQKYFSLTEDFRDMSSYINQHRRIFAYFVGWNICLPILCFLSAFHSEYSYFATRFREIFLAFSYWQGANVLYDKSCKVQMAEDSTRKVDRIVTCYIMLGLINLFSVLFRDTYIDYFNVLQGGLYIFEILAAHNFSTLLHNNEKMEFIEFNQISP